jgi:hypothetical protein
VTGTLGGTCKPKSLKLDFPWRILMPIFPVNGNLSKDFDDILPGKFNAQYADGTVVVGDYFTDDITVGGVTLEKYQVCPSKTTLRSMVYPCSTTSGSRTWV